MDKLILEVLEEVHARLDVGSWISIDSGQVYSTVGLDANRKALDPGAPDYQERMHYRPVDELVRKTALDILASSKDTSEWQLQGARGLFQSTLSELNKSSKLLWNLPWYLLPAQYGAKGCMVTIDYIMCREGEI